MIQGQMLSLNIVYACAMFDFQSSSLHIFKDISNDFNNLICCFKFFVPNSYDFFVGETMGGWLWLLLHCW